MNYLIEKDLVYNFKSKGAQHHVQEISADAYQEIVSNLQSYMNGKNELINMY